MPEKSHQRDNEEAVGCRLFCARKMPRAKMVILIYFRENVIYVCSTQSYRRSSQCLQVKNICRLYRLLLLISQSGALCTPRCRLSFLTLGKPEILFICLNLLSDNKMIVMRTELLRLPLPTKKFYEVNNLFCLKIPTRCLKNSIFQTCILPT